MSFSDAQKIDIRRFCGYPVFGGVPVQAFGWRFFNWYGTLEFRMNNLDPNEETVVTTTFLANLYTLETDIVGAASNLDTDQAAIWKHNKNEVRDRQELFDYWRKRLCDFFGIGPGPNFETNRGITMVV